MMVLLLVMKEMERVKNLKEKTKEHSHYALDQMDQQK
jgi:hypothetical protein